MRANRFHHLGDQPLLHTLERAVVNERTSMADVVELIAEVDSRRLFSAEGYPSMLAYCVGKLGLSEDAACRRIKAARLALHVPAVFDALRDGRLHLTAANLLDSHLTTGNADDLIGLAARKSKSEIELLLASRFPSTELLPLVEALPAEERNVAPALARVDATDGADSSAPARVPSMPRARVAALSAQSFALHFSVDRPTYETLRQVQSLLGHSIPSGDLARIFALALDVLKSKLEKRKFAATDKPGARRKVTNPRTIPAHVRRTVWERDGGRCTFVSESDHRCESTEVVEYDHIVPIARGGASTVENVRLRCRSHNQLEAERVFGAGFMEEKREAARRAADERKRDEEKKKADEAKNERAKDLTACLRNLGFRAEQVRRAVEHCLTLPDATLEEHVKAALACLCPKPRAVIHPGLAATA